MGRYPRFATVAAATYVGVRGAAIGRPGTPILHNSAPPPGGPVTVIPEPRPARAGDH